MWPIIALGTAALTAIYGLYHVIVGIRKHGWLYSRNRTSSSSDLGGFVAFQQMIEPQVQHVIEVKEGQGRRAPCKQQGDGAEGGETEPQ
jgi:hypothetical protein